jgi:hypothetical protein
LQHPRKQAPDVAAPKKACVCRQCAASSTAVIVACKKCGRATCPHLSRRVLDQVLFGLSTKIAATCGPCNLAVARAKRKAEKGASS